MKKLLMVAVASAAGVAVWRKVGATKPTQPWAMVTDKI
ncbi:DLW-39 family protein [Kineosporia mesophila]|nr:DLW-39 family protein [Kineosporia mesophila]MCD5350518.1 DLW-39 family protein [Kineosporia mesophila]